LEFSLWLEFGSGPKPPEPNSIDTDWSVLKFLLVMHVFAVATLIARPRNPRRARMMAGAAMSGLAIIAISAYLRHIF